MAQHPSNKIKEWDSPKTYLIRRRPAVATSWPRDWECGAMAGVDALHVQTNSSPCADKHYMLPFNMNRNLVISLTFPLTIWSSSWCSKSGTDLELAGSKSYSVQASKSYQVSIYNNLSSSRIYSTRWTFCTGYAIKITVYTESYNRCKSWSHLWQVNIVDGQLQKEQVADVVEEDSRQQQHHAQPSGPARPRAAYRRAPTRRRARRRPASSNGRERRPGRRNAKDVCSLLRGNEAPCSARWTTAVRGPCWRGRDRKSVV